MLDIIEPTARFISRGGGTYDHTHTDLADVSIYSDLAKIRRVPIDALTSWTDRTVHGEPIREIVEPTRLDGFSALMNKATGDLLQTRPVADTYKLVSHDELFSLQAKMVADSGLPTSNLEIIDRLYDGGLRAHRTIMFHDLDAVVGNSDDRVVCRMDVFNSVDMSWSFQIFSGAYRDLCRNTLVFGGEKAYHQKRKHTKNLSPAALIGKATMGLDFWQNNRDEMDRMRQTPLTRDQFGLILANTICAKPGAPKIEGVSIPVNERLLGYLLHRYDEEVAELGHTQWAAYNALTHWSTHTDTEWTTDEGKTYKTGKKDARTHLVQRKRSDDVRTVLDSLVWQAMGEPAFA